MRRGRFGLLMMLLIQGAAWAGCMGDAVASRPKARVEAAPTTLNVGDGVSFDARSSSTPEPGALVSYQWDFGDGETAVTGTGFVTHIYTTPGRHTVRLTVVNDQSGEDSTSIEIFVNGLPEVSLIGPDRAFVGDHVVLNASSSTDPEGGQLAFEWDFNRVVDDDMNGVPDDDVDAEGESVVLPTDTARRFEGVLRVTDDQGGMVILPWNVTVDERMYKVRWVQRIETISRDGALDEGEIWSENLTMIGRIGGVNATLILALDPFFQLPQDNFTLSFEVPSEGWQQSEGTQQENVTKNATAEIQRHSINAPPPEEEFISGISREEVLERVLSDPMLNVAWGTWTWMVSADKADPDCAIPNPSVPCDPDQGNDWELDIEIVLWVPVVTEYQGSLG